MNPGPRTQRYDSAARSHPMVEEFVALVRFRDLLFELVGNNLKSRYKRSILGVAWTLLSPITTMAVTSIAFSSVFRSSLAYYAVYVLAGLLMWNFFSQSTAIAMQNLIWTGGNILKRVYLPRTIFPVAAVGTGAVNLLLGMFPLFLISLVLGLRPTPALLFLPVALVVATAFVLGAALTLSAMAVFFTDVIDIFQTAVMAMFYVTPVLYPADVVPLRFSWVLTINPMGYILELFRSPIHLGRLPEGRTIAIAAVVALVSLSGGWWLFTRKADEIVYRT